MKLLNFLILWPERIAGHFLWVGPLSARITVGYVFMVTGWVKLQNLPQIIEYFTTLGIPAPHILTPFVAGLECFGGALLIVGLFTRIMGGGLAVTMIIAIVSAKWAEVDSLYTLLGLEETLFLAIFTWLAICGAGKASLDSLVRQ